MFIGDVSTIEYLPVKGEQGKPIRNANVLYEVGLSHACRLPEEVILLRSDNDVLDFDIAGVRVLSYNPNEVEKSINLVVELITEALKSVDNRKRMVVENTTKLFDVTMYKLLIKAKTEVIPHPIFGTMLDVPPIAESISAINRMLGLGILQTVFKEIVPEDFKGSIGKTVCYRITSFGLAVLDRIQQKNKVKEARSIFINSEDGKEWLAKQPKEK